MGIKKKIFVGWIALEVILLPVSIPAAAQIMDRVKLAFPARAAAVQSYTAPGHMQFIVASNAPFTVISDGAVGELKINITVSGDVNGNAHGARASPRRAVGLRYRLFTRAKHSLHSRAQNRRQSRHDYRPSRQN